MATIFNKYQKYVLGNPKIGTLSKLPLEMNTVAKLPLELFQMHPS